MPSHARASFILTSPVDRTASHNFFFESILFETKILNLSYIYLQGFSLTALIFYDTEVISLLSAIFCHNHSRLKIGRTER